MNKKYIIGLLGWCSLAFAMVMVAKYVDSGCTCLHCMCK